MPVIRRLAVLCTDHGFGHLTRQLAIGQHLRTLGIEPVFYTAAPPSLLRESLPDPSVVPWQLDVGLSQPDSLRVDLARTCALLDERCSPSALETLADHLAAQPLQGVIADLPPMGLEAARLAGLPAVAVGNFDWAWIYDHFPELAPWAQRFRAWQAPHPAIHLWPGPALSGFRRVKRAPLVGRLHPPHSFPAGSRHVLVSFGGLGLKDLEQRLPRMDGVTWVLSAPMPALKRADCLWLEDIPYPALVAGADAVLTKPGYGILAEAFLAGTPLAWLPRSHWPESPYLADPMVARGDVQVGESIEEALTTLWSRPRPAPHDPSGSALAARRILDELLETAGLELPGPAGIGLSDPVP